MPERNEPLSERELDILRLVATGKANKEIANQLLISPNTVKVHLRNIFAKIGVVSRTEATLYALKIGLVQSHAPIQGPAEAPLERLSGEAESAAVEISASATGMEGALLAQKPRTRWPAWLVGLLIVGALLLAIGGGIVGIRLLNGGFLAQPTTLSTAAAQSTALAAAPQRWGSRADLPSPRKGMAIIEYENGLYVVGGETSLGIDGALLRYDLAENTWTTLPNKPTAVTEVRAALVREKVYVPGGKLANGSATDRLEVYDPRKGAWENKAPIPEPLSAYGMASFEGQIYLFGGKNGEQYSASVYVYHPQEDRWEARTSMPSPRAYTGVVESGGKIYVIGGRDDHQALDANEAYLPNRDLEGEMPWITYAPLPEKRYAMGAVHLAGLVYLLGGLNESNQPAREPAIQYAIQADQWTEFDPPPVSIGASSGLLASGNYLYVLGGETPAGLSATNLTYRAIYTVTVPVIINEEP